MNRYKVINPIDLISTTGVHSADVEVVDFLANPSYVRFKANFIKEFMLLCSRYSVQRGAYAYLRNKYSQPSYLVRMKSSGTQVNFRWPNNEIKSMMLSEDLVITAEEYWLPSYPFFVLDRQSGPHGLYLFLNKDCVNSAEFVDLGSEPLYTISHNNHFGHFLFDDLPRIYADSLMYISHISQTPLPCSLAVGILELLNCIDLMELNQTALFEDQPKLGVVKSSNALQSFLTNPIMNIYILDRLFHSTRFRACQPTGQFQRIFLRRGGSYQSRIDNHVEISNLLVANGCSVVNPSSYSVNALQSKLSSASVIFTEAGTCSLVASLLAPKNCKVVTFVPETLLKNPTDGMIVSGLVYHLVNPAKQEFIVGTPSKPHPVQTSSICYYRPQDVLAHLRVS